MDFFSMNPDEAASIAKNAIGPSKIEAPWFSAVDGLLAIRTLQTNLANSVFSRMANEALRIKRICNRCRTRAIERDTLAVGDRLPTANCRLEPPVQITTIEPFLHYFSNVRERTLGVVHCVSPDKLDWSYSPQRFTLGDLLRHIAVTERYLFAENVQGRPSRYTSHGKEFGETYGQILLLLNDLHKQSMEIFARLTDEDLQKKCPTPGGVQITTWKWLRCLAEHEIHHRGQLYLYLALLGVPTPPLYGLTSEQVRSRSEH